MYREFIIIRVCSQVTTCDDRSLFSTTDLWWPIRWLDLIRFTWRLWWFIPLQTSPNYDIIILKLFHKFLYFFFYYYKSYYVIIFIFFKCQTMYQIWGSKDMFHMGIIKYSGVFQPFNCILLLQHYRHWQRIKMDGWIELLQTLLLLWTTPSFVPFSIYTSK